MHDNQLSKLSVQFIAQQRDLHALAGPVLATPTPSATQR
ncbi:hypothetical protein T11_1433 [Trichinella zimbabwensis]|uniref:Uncharacterized protein n=1 Tax=Trichinella zimbabwensis TaxID=268475 RepID=A0A0V1DPB3_9BILA|nr:hypothetical protein T11_1433 [Trichinella zimbabwensis]